MARFKLPPVASADSDVRYALEQVELFLNTAIPDVESATGEFFAFRSGSGHTRTTGQVITFDSESWDPHDWYDTSNGRYTPLKPGKYSLQANVELTANLTADEWCGLQVFKNGNLWDQGTLVFQRGTKAPIMSVYSQVDADGVDDFFDIRIVHNTGGSVTINFGASAQYSANFKGHYIGA